MEDRNDSVIESAPTAKQPTVSVNGKPAPAEGDGMSQQAPTFDPEQYEHDPVEESHMTLMEHLQELRVRLMWIGGALIIGTLISMLFAESIIAIIIAPVGAAATTGTAPHRKPQHLF